MRAKPFLERCGMHAAKMSDRSAYFDLKKGFSLVFSIAGKEPCAVDSAVLIRSICSDVLKIYPMLML